MPPRLAVISTAHIHTESFLKELTGLGAVPTVIWDDVAERGQGFADRFGSRFSADLEAVLAETNGAGLDGFIICAENTRHLALLERLIPLGRPIFCEKPLGVSRSEAEIIAKRCREHGTPLICGYFQPFSGRMRAVAQALADGRLGPVTHVGHRNAHSGAYGRWFDSAALSWFVEPALSGGGALLDLGTHSVHLLRSLFGPVTAVCAEVACLSGAYPAVDDYGVILLRFASGVRGRIEANWIHQGGHGGLEVFGQGGVIFEREQQSWLQLPKQTPIALDPIEARPDRMRRLLAAIDGSLSADELASDLDCALDAVRIMDAVYRSAGSASWESVSD